MRKILSFMLVLMMLLQVNLVPANAATKSTDLEKKLLTELEIIPKTKTDTSGLSRLELAEIITNLVNYETPIVLGQGETIYVDVPHTAEAAIVVNTVTEHGIMSGVGDGRFDPDSQVTLDQAIATVVSMLGYKNAALAAGTYPDGFSKMASGIGILDEVNLAEETITVGNLKTLLANAMATNVMVMTGVGENQKYEILKDEPFMTYTMGLKKVSGVVRGSVISAITEEAFTGFGEININGNVYGVGDFNVNDYVGYYVDACFVDEDDTYLQEIVYIQKSKTKNKTLEIYADEYRSWTGDEIVYIKNGESKRDKARIADGADYMYNGTPLTTYTEDDFDLEDGVIRMIDNTGDGKYDVISLIEYNTVVVKSINITKKTLLDMFVPENALSLNNADMERIKIVDLKGKEMSFDAIMVGDVVTWYVDRTGNNYTLIVAAGNSIVGTVTGKDLDMNTVFVDDEEYRISPEYIGRYDSELSYGKSGTFYLDYLDRIVGFDSGEGIVNEWVYGILLRAVYDEDNDGYLLKIQTEDNMSQFYTVAKNIRIDFEKIQEEDKENVIMNLTPGLIRFIKNPADEITKIDTLAEDDEEDSLIEILSGTYSWKGMGTDTFQDVLIVDAETRVFVPKHGSENEYEASTRAYFVTDKPYTFTAYGKADSKIADVIVVESADDDQLERVGVLVDVVATLNDDGEPKYRIKVRDAAELNKEVTLWGADDLTISGIVRGNIVGYTKNNAQEVTALRTLYNPQTGEKNAFGTLSSSISAGSIAYRMGKAYLVEKGDYMIVVDEEATNLTGTSYVYKLSLYQSRGQLYRYDESLPEKVVTATPGEVIDFEAAGDSCSRIMVVTSTGWPAGMIIFNDTIN